MLKQLKPFFKNKEAKQIFSSDDYTEASNAAKAERRALTTTEGDSDEDLVLNTHRQRNLIDYKKLADECLSRELIPCPPKGKKSTPVSSYNMQPHCSALKRKPIEITEQHILPSTSFSGSKFAKITTNKKGSPSNTRTPQLKVIKATVKPSARNIKPAESIGSANYTQTSTAQMKEFNTGNICFH